MENLEKKLREDGLVLIKGAIDADRAETLRRTLFEKGKAGTRCLLDVPGVADAAGVVRGGLNSIGILPKTAVAIQAIAFDKTAAANWKVTWHQDLMFPLAAPVTQPGYDLPSKKDGVDYARPPSKILEQLLAVRIHLDDCDASNGPLRVSPGTHLSGILRSTEIPERVKAHGEYICRASKTDALLMRPLLLHASSPALVPQHRRVLHFVFYNGQPPPERWHREI